MSESHRGRVAVVTGGRGGIGTAICTRLAREGASVYAADIEAQAEMRHGVRYQHHDVTREESARELMARVGREHGKLDILVNAAAIEIEHTIEHTTLEDWNRIFAVSPVTWW